jgi:putative pyruvate formate lyase activating enzyme
MRTLEECVLCPRACKVNRFRGDVGYCGIGNEILVSHYGPHFGEEPPISGTHGSGNIFFSSCNLRCVYCQNFKISHERTGKSITVDELTEIFFSLQDMGLHNINLVSPTPYVPFIAETIDRSKSKGIQIPFVYNMDTLRMLDGLIDIYLPDFKYWSDYIAHRLSHARDYPSFARRAILEMKRQVGNLIIEQGIARKGILVRHLVLPSNLAGSRQVLEWIKRELGQETYVSLMAQYNPLYRAKDFPMIDRRIKQEENDALLDFLVYEGFQNVFIQDLESAEAFVPNFEFEEPFAKQKLKG